MRALRRLADNRDPNSYANRLRHRRLALLLDLLSDVGDQARILDVGGTPAFWEVHDLAPAGSPAITILNLVRFESQDPRIETVVGNALDLSDFGDGSYDVVFSNSVIEHVGTLEHQQQMAREIRRVGRRYVVQTPNRFFPVEPHFLVPGFQFMPVRLRVELLTRFSLGWHARARDRTDAEQQVRSIRLMTEGELKTCFPEARIHRERLFGLTKSLIAVGGLRRNRATPTMRT